MAITIQSHQMYLSINYSCKPKQMYLVFARMLLFEGGCPDSRRTFFGCCVRLLQHLHLSVCCVVFVGGYQQRWLGSNDGDDVDPRFRDIFRAPFAPCQTPNIIVSTVIILVVVVVVAAVVVAVLIGGAAFGCVQRERRRRRRWRWWSSPPRERESVCVCVAFRGGGVSGGDSARNTPVVPSSSAYVWLMVVCVCVCGRCVAMRRCRRRGFGHI